MKFKKKDLNKFKMLCNLKKIQDGLTVKADVYRNRLLLGVNDTLLKMDLKPIPIQKYKDETDVLNTIRKLNLDNPIQLDRLDQFMCAYGIHNNHFLSNQGIVEINLVRDNGNYYTTGYIINNTDIVGHIHVSVQDILNTDDILFQPSLQQCIDISKSSPHKSI